MLLGVTCWGPLSNAVPHLQLKAVLSVQSCIKHSLLNVQACQLSACVEAWHSNSVQRNYLFDACARWQSYADDNSQGFMWTLHAIYLSGLSIPSLKPLFSI